MFDDIGTLFKGAATVFSVFVPVIGLFIAWRKTRESALRRGDVLIWANNVIRELQSLQLICTLRPPQLLKETAEENIRAIIFNTSILVEQGRFFFRNEIVDSYGQEKEAAYRGYRPKILDHVVAAHQVACKWFEADKETRFRLQLLAEDALKKFVSLVQKEVGRSRTASSDNRKGGDGFHIDQLLDDIDDKRLLKLKSGEY